MHPEDIKPEDNKVEDLSKTAIALTMLDPDDNDSIISFSIPLEWFFDGETTKSNKESVPFGDYGNVDIIYKNQTLLIEADAAIDVSIESSIPTHALIVKTAGDCNINATIGLHDSITIEAKDIAFNADTASERLTLICNKDTLNSIKINAEVITNSLNATANKLIISVKLDSKTRILDCNKISIEQTGAFTSVGFSNPIYEAENSNKLAYVAPVDTESRINSDFLENRGRFESHHGTVIVKNEIACLEHSVTKFSDDKLIFAKISFDSSGSFEASDSHLIWVKTKGQNTSRLALEGIIKLTRTIIQHPRIIFRGNCNACLSKIKILSKHITLLNEKPIKGDNVEIYAKNKFYTNGDCDINNFVINTNTAKISSVLDGNEFMSFQCSGKAEGHGLIYGKNTMYQGNFLLLSPITYDSNLTDLGFYKNCRKNGGLVGTESLTLNTVVLVRIAGGYIASSTVNGRTGVDINIGGLSYAYNYNFQRSVAPVELGFDLPWIPNGMHDLVSVNKILSLSYRMILTVGNAEYACIASALTLAGAAGPTVIRGIRSIGSSIYADPNPLNHLKHTRDLGVALTEKIARRTKELASIGYNIFSSRDGMATGVHNMQKTIADFYNSKKLLDLVNIMLDAKGMYISGNSIMYHATNVVKFTADMQQSTLSPLNLQQVEWRVSDNQANTYNWELLKFLGPSVYKSTLTVAVDCNYIVSGTVVQDAAILMDSTNVYAINAASSAIYRYDNGKYYTKNFHVNARHNTVYGKFRPSGTLVFNAASNYVAPDAEFILPADTRGFVTGAFITEGKVVISSGAFIIKGKFHVKPKGTANVNNAYFQKEKLIVEGKYTALNSILYESDQIIAAGAGYTVINSDRHGANITWEKGAKVNVVDSDMYGSAFEDLGASVTTTGNTRFKMQCIFRDGHWQVSGIVIFEAENVQTTLQSTLTGAETSHVEIHADHADLQGSENIQSSVLNVKDMSASEILEYLNNTGKHANKNIHKQLVMQTEKNEAIELNSFGRNDVGVAIVTPGAITQNALYHGSRLVLQSTENSVHLNNDIATELDTSIFAKQHIFKPGVVVESFKGNVKLVAEEGTLNNDNGGQILAHSGNITAIGAQFSNSTNGASRMSTIYGNNVVAGATEGAFDIFNGLLKAKTVLKIYAAADFNLQPEIIREWLSQHEMGNVYYGSVLQGGTGTPENSGVGLILKVGGKFNGAASSITSIGKNLIFVNKDIHSETKITVYKSEDYQEKHGFFRNKHYFTEQAAKEFRMEILSEDKNIIHSLEGKVQLEGVQTFAPNGTETYSEQEIIAQAASYTLHNTHNKNRHVHESKHSSKTEQEAMTVYAHTTGVTSFISDKFIHHNGVLYYGLPGSEFKFIAPDGITLTSNILNHRTTSTSVSAQLAVCGQPLIGSGRQLNPMNTVYYLDPTGGSFADFAHSSSIVEAVVNGASSMYGISNMLGSIAQNGLMNTLASQMGASLILTLTKTAFDYQTEGAGGFYGGANINMQTNGIATFAVNAHGKIAIFEVTADELRILNTILKSKFTSDSLSIAPSINLDGSYDLSASYAHQSSSSIAQLQRNLSFGTFNLNVRYLHNRGANIVCNKINGTVDIIENENTANTTTSTQTQVSASMQGSVSGSHVHATEETEGAKASILVTDGINNDPDYNVTVNTVINHGDATMSTLGTDTEVVHVDQTLKSTRVGGGFSHNFSNKVNKPLPKLSVDLLNQISTINEDGLTVTQRRKFNATVPVPRFTAPKTAPTEESFINLGETNAINALSGRRLSIIGDALEQLESNDFLVDPGYRYGQPSNAVEDSEGKQLLPERLKTQNKNRHENFVEKRHINELQPEKKSWGTKVGKFFHDVMMDADDVQLDYWDVPTNPVVTAGRAAITRGFAKGAVAAVQPLMHPIDTLSGVVVTTWDGLNVLSDVTFGVATDASRKRSADRGAAVVDGIYRLRDADPIQRMELGSEFIGTMLFGYGIVPPTKFGAVKLYQAAKPEVFKHVTQLTSTVINTLKPITPAQQMPRLINLELSNRILTLQSEFASLSNIYDYRQLQEPILPLFRPLGHQYAQRNKANLAKNIRQNYNDYFHKKQTGNGFYSGLADDAYDAIRTNKHDVSNIAKNTGFKEKNIQRIKDHLFYDKHFLIVLFHKIFFPGVFFQRSGVVLKIFEFFFR